jgi:hypothetical protein
MSYQQPSAAQAVRPAAHPWVSSDTPVTEPVPAPEVDLYLTECASCGGQFPSFRAICAECEDVAEVDGYRDGRKAV